MASYLEGLDRTGDGGKKKGGHVAVGWAPFGKSKEEGFFLGIAYLE